MRCWRILAACSIFGEYYNLVPWAGKGQQNGLSEGLKKSLTLEAWEEMMWPISSYHHLEDGQAGGAQPLLCQID